MPPTFQPSARMGTAVALAAQLHGEQVRKGTTIPYLSHLLAVASLVMEHGGDEDQTIAAILHDAIEDAGPEAEALIREQFGDRVTALVWGCTDGIPDAAGQKPDWRDRKQQYLQHLATVDPDILLVSACDKLHNARSILIDLQNHGLVLFDRFKAGQAGTIWYYQQLANCFQDRLPGPLSQQLSQTVEAIQQTVKQMESPA
ncbi:HD domain-containing protein [Synechococcus elongatus]|uniref:HD domain-containing protein n=1 Tax=Synechococcus elongatus TaxID=32046 RepID=UPI0030CAA12D